MDTITVDTADSIRTVTLNRPKLKNAINSDMWNELLDVFRDTADDAEVRVLVVTGAGGAFCSGADLSGGIGTGSTSSLDGMRHVGDVCMALHRIAKPTIAKVGGVAAGAGLNLALGCDLVVASDDARFSEIFAKRNLSLDFGGSWLLPRLIGLHKAKELAFFADKIPAAEAERLGLVNCVVPAGELDAQVKEWTSRLLGVPVNALTLTKQMLNDSYELSFERAIEEESRAQTINASGIKTPLA